MVRIVLDAGHGGRDPGAIGKKSKEKDNVLKVVKKLKILLEYYGHEVILTRGGDGYLTLTQRANIANNRKADIFVSLHNNSASNDKATGFETFIFNGNVSNKTKQLQTAVHNAIAKNIGIPDRGKKSANFAVLRQTKMPSLLIEYAFINNPFDESILINRVDDLAQWTCDGIIDAVGGTLKGKSSKTSKPNKKPSKASKNSGKTITQMVQEVIDGKHGNGHAQRKKSLGISANDYKKVRDRVNAKLTSKKTTEKSISQMATEVLAGKHGNGHANRRKSLGISQAQYNKVRAEVNKRLR